MLWSVLQGFGENEKLGPQETEPGSLMGNNSDSSANEPWLHIALYQPEIPQNTGNIGRTCVALGAKLWIIRPTGFRLDAQQLRRAGLDYWQHLVWEAVDHWDDFLTRFSGRRIWIITKFGKAIYHQAKFQRSDVLLFGSETSGLPPGIHAQFSDHSIQIPMREEARSLNLSNAVSIVAYEAHRQLAPTN